MTDPGPLDTLFEDGCLLAVAKPAGVVVHPAYRNRDGTLLDALRERSWPAAQRPSIVGRLDKGTSGVVLVAKHAAAHAALQRALAAPQAEKMYLAIVLGIPPSSGTIELPLTSDPADRRRRIVSERGARSVTAFQRMECGDGPFGEVALLGCRLVTGRRHQIRVHLATNGWPILGDGVYGATVDGLARHALHAWRVAFAHPFSAQWIAIEAPPPQDFCSLLYSAFAETSSGRSASAFFQFDRNRS